MATDISLVNAHKGREVIYSSFGKVFLDIPSAELYRMFKVILPQISHMADGDNRLINDGLTGLNNFIACRDKLKGDELNKFDDTVCREFTRLYCLSDSVPISESVYTSVEHLAMQEAAGKVQGLYDACKFDMKHTSNEPSDHISYELTFMSYLAKGTYRHMEKGNNDEACKLLLLQKKFISEHILKWLGDFTKATLKFPESVQFYAPAAYFILGYIKEDLEFLEQCIS